MKLLYPMRFEAQEDGGYIVQGVDSLTNVITEADTHDEALSMAREALTAVLGAMLDEGEPIPRPSQAAGNDIEWIAPEAYVAAPILLRWARQDAKLTQSEIAGRLGITRQSYHKLEQPSANASVRTLARAMRVLGRNLVLEA